MHFAFVNGTNSLPMITLKLPALSESDKEQLRNAILLGRFDSEIPQSLRDSFLSLAESLPGILRNLGWEDNSANREKALELIFYRVSTPRGKAQRPGAYRRILNRK